MSRPHCQFFLLLSVLSAFLSGCGGFNGILAPTLTSITPTTVAAGGAAFTLTATGSNFVSGTTILWDGTSLPTTVTSSTKLTANVTAAQIASGGTVSIRVLKPDSTTSGTIMLTVTGGSGNGSFELTNISPSAVAAGSASFTLTATGVGFVSGAAITLNGTAITTTFDSATQLHATVAATAIANAGTITVGVTNPDNSTTNTLVLTVTGAGSGTPPTLTSINPNTSTNGLTAPLTLTATDGTLKLGSTTGITITSGANGSASMTISGTLSALNNALSGLTFVPINAGKATIVLSYTDVGTGLKASATINITVGKTIGGGGGGGTGQVVMASAPAVADSTTASNTTMPPDALTQWKGFNAAMEVLAG